MTANPKPRKAPATLLELTAKIDAEKARYNQIKAAMDDSRGRDDATRPVLSRIYRLEERISKVRATNLDEVKLKARACCFASGEYDPDYDEEIAPSIVRDLLAMSSP